MIAARLAAASLAVAVGFALGDAPRFAPAEGSSLQRTVTTEMNADSTEMHFSVDGKELDASATTGMSMSMREHQKIVMTDRYVKVASGRPVELDRTFDELVRTTHDVQKPPGQGKEKVVDKAEISDLEGATVRFSWNADKKAYDRAFAGKERDEKLISKLREDLDARVFLPQGDAAADPKVGDSWEIDGQAFVMLLSPDKGLQFHVEGKEQKKSDDDVANEMEKNLTGEGKVTYEKVRETDGTRIAVLVIEGKVQSKAKPEDGDMTVSMDIEGRLLWNLSANRLESLDLTGKTKIGLVGDQKMEHGGAQAHTLHMDVRLEGEMHLELSTKAP